MLFQYESVIDVGNVTEYTIKNLVGGKTYYLAAIAYDEDGNESAYSIELIHKVSFAPPAKPQVLIFKMPDRQFSDSIKEIIEEK